MVALHGRRHLTLALLVLAVALALLSQTVTAQSNMCYPTPGKRSKLKKGPCFMVSHTLPGFLGLDMPAALDPLSNDFVLVDRHTGSPINPACVRTKVYVSSDATPVDMGHFKREAWATQAMILVQGKLQVDHAAIAANVAAGKQARKQSKHNVTTETIFMVEFQCPPATAGGAGKWTSRQARHSEYRAALRYVPAPTNITPSNFYQQLLLHLQNMNQGRMFQSAESGNSIAVTSMLDDIRDEKLIHFPTCEFLEATPRKVFCDAFGGLQIQGLGFPNSSFIQNLACAGDYPSYMQGLIDQSRNVSTDKHGNRLPGRFANLLTGGQLPFTVDASTVENEKATLWWLFDKTQQLGPWAACDNGQVPYGLADQLAPGFSAPTLYYIDNVNEFPDSNFTRTALVQSAVGLDVDNNKTFLVVSRGTKARSEWMIDLEYNQILVTNATLESRPSLYPFKGMAIHSGFAGLFEQVYSKIATELSTVNPRPNRIIVTGHSLGGGLAQLLALALAQDFFPIPVDAALFAPPTAGDPSFAQAYNTRVNGRRVAYTSSDFDPRKLVLAPSLGDAVPQVLCPDMYLCTYKPYTELLEKIGLNLSVPVRTSFESWTRRARYQAVDGNVLFNSFDLPDNPYDRFAPDLIRLTWQANDNIFGEVNNHICSYGCYFSTAVNAPLNKCFTKENAKLDKLNVIPDDVKAYGLC